LFAWAVLTRPPAVFSLCWLMGAQPSPTPSVLANRCIAEILDGKKTHPVYVNAITGKVHETK
jgi:hypothetical protein